MIKDQEKQEEDLHGPFNDPSKSTEKLNKVMERLRARLFTLAEAVLPADQANSFKKAIKDYTSESWNGLTKLVNELENKKLE